MRVPWSGADGAIITACRPLTSTSSALLPGLLLQPAIHLRLRVGTPPAVVPHAPVLLILGPPACFGEGPHHVACRLHGHYRVRVTVERPAGNVLQRRRALGITAAAGRHD